MGFIGALPDISAGSFTWHQQDRLALGTSRLLRRGMGTAMATEGRRASGDDGTSHVPVVKQQERWFLLRVLEECHAVLLEMHVLVAASIVGTRFIQNIFHYHERLARTCLYEPLLC